jgi:hypothetical protein
MLFSHTCYYNYSNLLKMIFVLANILKKNDICFCFHNILIQNHSLNISIIAVLLSTKYRMEKFSFSSYQWRFLRNPTSETLRSDINLRTKKTKFTTHLPSDHEILSTWSITSGHCSTL